MTGTITLPESREQREAEEFIDILKDLSHDERTEVKGYMKCLRNIRIMTNIGEKTEGKQSMYV